MESQSCGPRSRIQTPAARRFLETSYSLKRLTENPRILVSIIASLTGPNKIYPSPIKNPRSLVLASCFLRSCLCYVGLIRSLHFNRERRREEGDHVCSVLYNGLLLVDPYRFFLFGLKDRFFVGDGEFVFERRSIQRTRVPVSPYG